MGWWTAIFGLLLAMPVPASAEPATDPYVDALADAAPAPALQWSDCDSGFSCATARVPLDYTQPAGRAIELSVIKLPATDPAHRIGTLFVNFGGPGRSGVARLRERAHWPWLFSDALRARFDLVSWDTRGVANSAPVHCFPDATAQQLFFAAYPPMPGTPAAEAPFFAAAKTLADGCAQRAGDLLPHLSTENTARDLDLLRRAVGDDKLSFHGISYGTYLGALYANMFPGRVRGLVLDGSMDFRGNALGVDDAAADRPIDTRQDVATGIAGTFDAMLDACVAAGPECAFSEEIHGRNGNSSWNAYSANRSRGTANATTTAPSSPRRASCPTRRAGRSSPPPCNTSTTCAKPRTCQPMRSPSPLCWCARSPMSARAAPNGWAAPARIPTTTTTLKPSTPSSAPTAASPATSAATAPSH